MHRLLGSALFSAMLVVSQGCSDGDDDTDTGVADTGPGDTSVGDTGPGDTGSGDTGMAYVPDWSCLGSVTIPAPAGATAALTGDVRDFTASMGEVGVELAFCLRDDTDCTAPVETVTTDDMGLFTATLPTDPDPFWGFAVATKDGFPRHEYVPSTPIFEDTMTFFSFLNTGLISIVASAVGTSQDLSTNGAVGAAALDCTGRYASGVRFELVSGSGTTYYGEGSPLTFTTTGTETDPSGLWGVVNAVPGDFTVATFLAADDTPIATIEFTAKAGVVSFLYMNPSPDGAVYSP